MKIVMLDPLNIDKSYLDEVAKELVEYEHEFVPCLAPYTYEEKKALVQDADVLIISNQPFTKELVDLATNLEYLIVAFTGVDHVDKSLFEKDVTISNASGYATVSTAELTISMILNCLRSNVILDDKTRNGGTINGHVGNELLGKTVGIIGGGKIGSYVARILYAFGCNVLVHDNNISEELEQYITYVTLDDLLENSDIVSIHTPLNNSTTHLIDKDKLSKMKESAFIINCARGAIINTNDLIDALNNGTIKGAGLDVFDTEPPFDNDYPIFNAKNTVLTPHIAYYTEESMVNRANIVFDNLFSYFDGYVKNKIK